MQKRTLPNNESEGTFQHVQRLRNEGKDTEAVQVLGTFAINNPDEAKLARDLIQEINVIRYQPPQSPIRVFLDVMGIPQGITGRALVAAEHC